MTTMHINFNHEIAVDGNKATSYSYGRALHKQQVSKGEDYRNIYATYEHELVKQDGIWKVSRLKMTPIFQEGNTNLVNQAYEDTTREEKEIITDKLNSSFPKYSK